jgi:hypothetical protein
VTNRLYKEGNFVQICWTRCNKTSNIQCCQYSALIRILPEEPNSFSPKDQSPVVDANALSASSPASRTIPNKAKYFRTNPFSAPSRGETVGSSWRVRFLSFPPDLSPRAGECPNAVNAFAVSVYTFRILCVCLQRSVARTLQQPLDSGTTARRTFVVVQIHSEVNRLEHSNRGFAIHRPHNRRRLPPAPRPAPARISP